MAYSQEVYCPSTCSPVILAYPDREEAYKARNCTGRKYLKAKTAHMAKTGNKAIDFDDGDTYDYDLSKHDD